MQKFVIAFLILFVAITFADGHKASKVIPVTGNAFYPESVAVHDDYAYVSAFFTGEIQKINMMSGEAESLVVAGNDGVVSGWGLWYDDHNSVLLACANRNAVPGPQENVNAARAIDTNSGDILATWELPAGTACNSIFTDPNGDIYLSDVSPNASIIKIDRTTDEVTTWLDDPAWENDSGFGVGGLIGDGGSNLYASAGGPLFRISINEDGSAGQPVMQTFIDAEGNEILPFSFDGFAAAGSGKMYGASFDFEAFQTQVVELTVVDDKTVQAEVIFTDAVGITGIDADHSTVFAADGQIIQALFVENYEPQPFVIHAINHGHSMSKGMHDSKDKESHHAAMDMGHDGMGHEGMSMMPEAEVSTFESGSILAIYDYGEVKLHAYTGGPAANGTYVIESENELVIIDAQFLAPIAQEFRAYADSLGKPINRVIITHEHVDHWFGLGAAFTDVEIYTTEGTRTFLNETGQEQLAARAENMGAVPKYVPIGNTLPQGGETIDGLRYNYFVFQDAEAIEQVVTYLPQLEVLLIGDLIYNDFYLILEPGFDNWINILISLEQSIDASLILPGHGPPADRSVISNNIRYLETAKELFATADGPEDFQAKMITLYPDLGGEFFWELILGRLYDQ